MHGERPAPRRLGVAFLLSLLMPGLGHLYCGMTRRGLLVWAGVLAVLLSTLGAWAAYIFIPWLPALVLVSAWSLLQLWLLADLRGFVRHSGADYQLRPLNHWLSYLAVFLGLGVLPLVLAGGWVGARVGSVAVRTDAMFPALLPGDRLLVDRDAFRYRAPERGELVVLEGQAGQAVARVVATGGTTVQLRDGRATVDGQSPVEERLIALRVRRFGPAERDKLDALRAYRERQGPHSYVVTYGAGARHADGPPVVLGQREFYVLGDNRTAALQAQVFGRVEWSAIAGAPVSIWLSVDADGAPRQGRVGVVVR